MVLAKVLVRRKGESKGTTHEFKEESQDEIYSSLNEMMDNLKLRTGVRHEYVIKELWGESPKSFKTKNNKTKTLNKS